MSKSRRSNQSRAENPEEVISQVKSIITTLDEVVSSRPHEAQAYLPSARSAVTALERLHFFRDPQRFAEQVWIIQGLQDFAYYDADRGSVRDVAEFCQASWLRVLRNYPENVEVLTGLGRNWLQRSQEAIAQIQLQENNDSQTGTSPNSSDYSSFDDSDDSIAPVDPQRQGPLYVEARGYLQPAVDFYARAVQSAEALGNLDGNLLSSAAESQMSLGNVTASPGDERYFFQAIRYLRQAAAIPGYRLSVYHQQYLNDYGRYVV